MLFCSVSLESFGKLIGAGGPGPALYSFQERNNFVYISSDCQLGDALRVSAAPVYEFDGGQHVVVVNDKYYFPAASSYCSVTFHKMFSLVD